MIWRDLMRIRAEAPLVLNITNYVVMNTTANALLAIGASPVMAHAVEEVEELTGLARALVINIGTLSAPWIEAMRVAGKAAVRLGVPVVLDPVGCGATRFRTSTVQSLIAEVRPTVIRGNASEIRALVQAESLTKGVDSLHSPEEILDEARQLARAVGCVVSVSGPVDVVVDGERIARVANGHSMMTRVTGMGCTASAITGAYAAVCGDAFDAAVSAMAVVGMAGEIAAEHAAGPGSFQVGFLDALHGLGETEISRRLKPHSLNSM